MIDSIIQRTAAWVVKKSGVSLAGWGRGDDLGGQPDRLSQPYKRSAWVRSAISKISGPVGSVSVDFYNASTVTRGGGRKKRRYRTARGIVRRDDDPVSIPALEEFLQAPMKGFGWTAFVDATVVWRKLAGEAFWIMDDTSIAFPEARAGLQVIVARPDRMRHVVEAGELVGWVFTDGAGQQWPILPEQVVHLKSYNPYDEFRGLGEFEAARVAAETDWLAGRYARNIMANNGDAGPYIVAKSGIPDDNQRKQIVEQLRSKRAAQQRGEFRPAFITGDISVEDPKLQVLDAAAIANRIENRHEVYIAFGVPPSMADVRAAYSIGSASDFYQLILNTCIPEGDNICDGLSRLARVATGQSVEAFLNWDEHPVMQEVRKERLTTVDSLWSKGVPMSVIDEYLDLGLPFYEGADVGYLPFSVIPVKDAGSTPAPEADPALAETDPVEAMLRALRSPVREPNPDSECCGCGCDTGDIDPRAPKHDVARWREMMMKQRSTMKAFEMRFNRELNKARTEVLRRIEGGSALLAFQKAAAFDFIFDLSKFKAGLVQAMSGQSANALQVAGDQLFAELKKDEPWKMPAPKALEFLRDRENKIANTADDVHAQVMDALSQGLQSGDTMKQLTDRVRAEFNDISQGRAKTIARTETSAAFGTARNEAMKSAGVQYKRWLVSGNSNIRAAHRLMTGATVPVGEKFMVINPKTGETDEVDYPGDPNGAPWNVINCACVAIAETKPESGSDTTET